MLTHIKLLKNIVIQNFSYQAKMKKESALLKESIQMMSSDVNILFLLFSDLADFPKLR